MALLEVKHLHTFFKTRKGIVKAVNDVSYSLEPGRTIGIVGESGSGKSVSAMSILRLLDGNGYIDSGEVIFEGQDLTKLAIGSSSKNTKLILKRLGLTGYFDAVSDGTNITRSKPDPEVFLCAAQYLGLCPGKCLVVEDAKAGILAAKAGGFDSAGLGEAAAFAFVTYSLQSFSDLLKLDGNR